MDCPVCLTAYDDKIQRPCTLPCGHTYCTPCVNGLMKQGQAACPNCRVVHAVPGAGQFPISFDFEKIMMMMSGASLASPSLSAEKDTAESAHSLGTRPGEKGQQGLSKRVRSLLKEQETKILAAIHNCQKVKAQLNQYETTVRDWGRQQQDLEDRLQSLIDQCKDARVLARHEELSASDKRQQVDHGEQQLHTVLKAVRTAASAVEAYETIEDADHVMEEETQRKEECLAMIYDVHTVTTIKKAMEVSHAALEAVATVQAAQQTAGVGADAAGDASLPAAAASSIRDRVDSLMSPPLRSSLHPAPKSLRAKNLRKNLRKNLKDLLPVFAVHTTEERSRHAIISLEDNRLYLHCLRDQPLPRCAVTLQVDEVAADALPCLVFLMLAWPGSAPRRVLVRLSHDTPIARQFLLLCTGQRGPCYAGTRLFRVKNVGQPGENVRGGDYEQNNGEGGAALLPDLGNGVYGKSWSSGDVWWWRRDRARGAQFGITIKGKPMPYYEPRVFGKVVGGLEVVAEAARHHTITEVSMVDCGVVVD